MKKRITPGLALAVLALAGLTACGPDDHRGDPGKVIARDHDMWSTKSGKVTTWHHDYDLTVQRSKDGSTYELDVTGSGYDHCYRGSSYPKCVDR